MRKPSWPVALLVAGLAGCGGGGDMSLVITLPDEAARQQTAFIHAWALEATDTSVTCADLLAGSSLPGGSGTTVEAETEFSYPVEGAVEPLQQVGPGERLFYAEGLDSGRRRLLAGCSVATAGGGGPGQITIALAWVEACEETNGGQETCDGVDNDCDQATDEGTPAELCPARDHATAGGCSAGQCSYTCEAEWWNADGDWSDGCECQRTLGGVEWCDGVDNDCDGTVDGAGCQHCTQDADCAAAGGPCLRATCNQGACETEPLDPGDACSDGNQCTEGDECDAQGACVGTARVCNDGIGCTDDACDPADGQCKPTLQAGFCLVGVTCVAEGELDFEGGCLVCDPALDPRAYSHQAELCEDGLFCNGQAGCTDDGACYIVGTACEQMCLTGCDEDRDQCLPDEPGGYCEDGLSCTENSCDGEGNCLATPNDALCMPGYSSCLPACSSDPSGCVQAPTQVQVDCPDDPPADQANLCQVWTDSDPRAALCVECRVDEQYPVVLAESLPWNDPDVGACRLGDWEQLDFLCSFDTGSCPMGGGLNSCCSYLECGSGPPDGALAIRLGMDSCSMQGVALGRELDLRSYSAAYVCVDFVPDNVEDPQWGVQVEARQPGNGATAVGGCAGAFTGSFQETLSYCLEVPREALSWPVAEVVLRIQPPDSGRVYLRSARVVGMPGTCMQPYQSFFTNFGGCPGGQINDYQNWQIPSLAYCGFIPMGTCWGDYGLVVGEGSPLLPTQFYLDMFTEVDLTALDHGAQLCWLRSFVSELGENIDGTMEVQVSSPMGSSSAYREQFDSRNQLNLCERLCVDLDGQGIKHSGQPNVSINISAQAYMGYLVMDEIALTGWGRCQADGTAVVGAVQEAEGRFEVPVSSGPQVPIHPVVDCAFRGGNSGEDDFRFVLPVTTP